MAAANSITIQDVKGGRTCHGSGTDLRGLEYSNQATRQRRSSLSLQIHCGRRLGVRLVSTNCCQ